MTDPEKKAGRTIVEEIEVAGHQLVERVKELVKEGNVREVRIRTEDGDVFLKAPLNVGVIAGPFLAILGVLAALVTRVRVEVERDTGKDAAGKDVTPPKDRDAA
jgi:hypothetical protein